MDHLELCEVFLFFISLGVDGLDSGKRIFLSRLDLLSLLISYEGFVWLFAGLVEHSKVVPDVWLDGVERGGLDDVLKRVTELTLHEVDDGESCPVASLTWILEGSLLQEIKSFLEVVLSQIAPSFDVKGVSLAWLLEVSMGGVLKALIDLA